jgi:hypothetical protein
MQLISCAQCRTSWQVSADSDSKSHVKERSLLTPCPHQCQVAIPNQEAPYDFHRVTYINVFPDTIDIECLKLLHRLRSDDLIQVVKHLEEYTKMFSTGLRNDLFFLQESVVSLEETVIHVSYHDASYSNSYALSVGLISYLYRKAQTLVTEGLHKALHDLKVSHTTFETQLSQVIDL